jgi:hypothetical protein
MESNIHHQIPISRGGLNGTNKIIWDVEKHKAYHTLFDNSLPHEAIAYIVMVHQGCFSDKFKEALMGLLADEPEEMYKQEHYKDPKLLEIPDNILSRFHKLFDAQSE